MPFNELSKGRKRNVTIEIKGPRSKAEQKRLKAALKKLLSKHRGAKIKAK